MTQRLAFGRARSCLARNPLLWSPAKPRLVGDGIAPTAGAR